MLSILRDSALPKSWRRGPEYIANIDGRERSVPDYDDSRRDGHLV